MNLLWSFLYIWDYLSSAEFSQSFVLKCTFWYDMIWHFVILVKIYLFNWSQLSVFLICYLDALKYMIVCGFLSLCVAMMVLFLVSAAIISNSSSHGNLTTGISSPDVFFFSQNNLKTGPLVTCTHRIWMHGIGNKFHILKYEDDFSCTFLTHFIQFKSILLNSVAFPS